MSSRGSVLVVTVVHHPEDARIRHREIAALLESGYAVTYAAPFRGYGLDLPHVAGLTPVDLPRAVGRNRLAALRAARRLLSERARAHDVVLVHDPELLLAAAGLRLPNLVWDVHEDTAAAIDVKTWLPPVVRRPAAGAVRVAERLAERTHPLLLAEYAYAERFTREHPVVPNTVLVPEEVSAPTTNRVVYLGSLTMARGAGTMAELGRLLVEQAPGELSLEIIGPPRDAETAACLEAAQAAGHVVLHGFVPSDQALRLLDGALAGLSLLQDRPNYRHSMPTKIVEYMAHGVPVVTTPLPLARELVEAAGCGVVVPFDDAPAAAAALLDLHRDRDRARRLADNGRRHAAAHYDWRSLRDEFVATVDRLARESGAHRSAK